MDSRSFQLGDWRVDPALHRLSRGDIATTVEPKTMEVLAYLSENAGRVVSADELIEHVWDGRAMSDNPVYKCIAALRKVLGDDAREPRYIATVTKRGYRMLVEPLRADVEPHRGVAPAVPAPSTRVRRVPSAGFAVGVVIVVALGGAVWRSSRITPDLGGQSLLSTFPGSHSSASFSPDGRRLAFSNDVEGTSHIWTLELGSGETTQVTFGDDDDVRPQWSPDGETILFGRSNGLWKVPSVGGEPTPFLRNAVQASWARHGGRIAFERNDEIWVCESNGSNQRRLDSIPTRRFRHHPRTPAISPDGEHIAFFHARVGPFGDYWVVPVAAGPSRQLTSDDTLGGEAAWTPDGRALVVSSQRGGSRTLWRVPVAGGEPRAVLQSPGDDGEPALSPDGRSLVYTNTKERHTLTLTDPETGESQTLLQSRRMIFGPTASPFGDEIAYFGPASNGEYRIFAVGLDGTPPRAVTNEPGTMDSVPQWAADGEHIYFYRFRPESSLRRVPSEGGPSSVVFDGWDWNRENDAQVHPDDASVVYSRLDRSVPVATFVRDIDDGRETTFGTVLETPQWSRDGARIAGSEYSDSQTPYAGDIVVCSSNGVDCVTLADDAQSPMWSPDNDSIFYVRRTRTGQRLWARRADGSGEERELVELEPTGTPSIYFAVTPNGRIAWVRRERSTELWSMDLPQ